MSAGKAGAFGGRGEPDYGVRGKVSPGSADDGIEKNACYLSGAPAGRCAHIGGFAPREDPDAHRKGDPNVGSLAKCRRKTVIFREELRLFDAIPFSTCKNT